MQEVPAWRKRNAAVRRALSVVLTNGFVIGGLLCGHGEDWFLSVTRRVLEWVTSRRDLVLSLPAVSILSHHSLWDLMLFWRSPPRYLTRVVMDMRPMDEVVLPLKGKLPLRAK